MVFQSPLFPVRCKASATVCPPPPLLSGLEHLAISVVYPWRRSSCEHRAARRPDPAWLRGPKVALIVIPMTTNSVAASSSCAVSSRGFALETARGLAGALMR